MFLYEKLHKTIFLVSLILGFFLSSCHHPKKINVSFYYWKTVYKVNKTEAAYINHFNVHKLYVRIMDIDLDENSLSLVPVSPVLFKSHFPDSLQIVPVVFVVNDILKNLTKPQLNDLANKILQFTNSKVLQAGKTSFREFQIDCDWTRTTRDNYFYLLNQIKHRPFFKNKILSVTLRLHQLKSQKNNGIPPADRVMLMCYNMGNLRKYGNQNSILETSELKKYAGHNITTYALPVDIGLPLFSWAVAFRDKEYFGISKRIKINDLNNKNQFIFMGNNLYKAAIDLPEFGLNKTDEIRWEQISLPELEAAAGYLSSLIKTDSLNVIYFHLDENVLKAYKYGDLEKFNDLLR